LKHRTVPPWAVASIQFADDPQRVELPGVRAAHREFFDGLEPLPTWEARAQRFHDYLDDRFQLSGQSPLSRTARKNSYLRYLRGWAVDSSSIEGAVLKGWVEARFGLLPTFHKRRIGALGDDAYQAYTDEWTHGATHTNEVFSQLDLLYEFTQDELELRHPREARICLYRGVDENAEHSVISQQGKRQFVVRTNNLCSFTLERELAWEFGSTVWEAAVPFAKIFFFSGLFPTSLLRGEAEHLVIGGELRVRRVMD
jgi:NAD+---dinitrogen-reductase ADP-D-ribosyltransferase